MSIKIPILNTPEAFVAKYVSHKLGFNIRPEKSTYNNKTNTYTVKLKAIIPSLVKLENKKSKTFVYTFENLGTAEIKYDDYDFDFVTKPSAPELDNSLLQKFDELTLQIEKIILEHGKYSWGKLTNIRYWLGPLRSIIIRCLKEGDFYAGTKVTPRYIKYFEFLQKTDWIKYESGSNPRILTTNKLSMIHETFTTNNTVADLGTMADTVIGDLCANHYSEIRNELRIFGLDIYVTTTKAYYADAVREGRSIPMSEHRLWLKYRSYNYAPRPASHKEYTFSNALAELISNNFLQRTDDEQFITANNDLLEKLLPYHEKLAENIIEI